MLWARMVPAKESVTKWPSRHVCPEQACQVVFKWQLLCSMQGNEAGFDIFIPHILKVSAGRSLSTEQLQQPTLIARILTPPDWYLVYKVRSSCRRLLTCWTCHKPAGDILASSLILQRCMLSLRGLES